jgi:hypothetical protein
MVNAMAEDYCLSSIYVLYLFYCSKAQWQTRGRTYTTGWNQEDLCRQLMEHCSISFWIFEHVSESCSWKNNVIPFLFIYSSKYI